MTREEAIKALRLERGIEINGNAVRVAEFLQGLGVALSVLRPVSREQVEKVWRGEWTPGDSICPICEKNKFDGLDADIWADWMPSFCPNCGAPMTDKAVEMVMERLEALYGE